MSEPTVKWLAPGGSETWQRKELANALLVVEEVFEKQDLDKNRRLDGQELKTALNMLGLPCDEEHIDFLVCSAKNRKCGLDVATFEEFVLNLEHHYRKVFRDLDVSKNGAISREELKRGFETLQIKIPAQDLEQLFVNSLKKDETSNSIPNEMNYLQWRQALMCLPPEASNWNDTMFQNQFVSSDIGSGENIRPAPNRGDGPLTDLAAGFIAGCVSRTITAPAERIKTELQLVAVGQKRSAMEIFRVVLAESGWKGFFAGNLTNCAKVAPQAALFFALTDYFKRELPTGKDPANVKMHSFLCGTLAGCISQAVIYPLEPVKTALCVAKKGQYNGMWDCTKQLMANGGGVRALFRGLGPTLAGCIPYAGTQRVGYDWLKKLYLKKSKADTPNVYVNFGIGLVSSTGGMTVSYPLLLIRTRIQMQGTSPERPAGQYNGTFDCFSKVIKSEGPKGIFRGLTPNLLKAAPASAVSFAIYDTVRQAIVKARSTSGA